MAAAELTFPMYKTEQLAHFFRTEVLLEQEGKQFSKSDLHPVVKPETVQMLYMRTLQHVYRINPECLHMLPINLPEDIEIPAFHETATALLRLYHRMRLFLPTCLVYDFNLIDLLSPKTKKTALILSGIMNHLQFRKQRVDFVLEHDGKLRADKDRLQGLTRGIEDAEKKLVILKTIPPELQAEAKELKSSLAEQRSTNAQAFNEVHAVKDLIAAGKSKRAERNQALTKLKVDVSTRYEDNLAIQSQILESPEELEMEMDKMKQTVKSIKAATVKSDEFVVELQSKAQVLNHSDSEVQLICSLLQDLHTGLQNGKQDVLEVDKGVSELKRRQKEMKSLAVEVDREKRSDAMKLDKLSKQRLRRKNMRETAECHIQSVMKKCDLYPEKQKEIDDYIRKINKEMQPLKAKIQIIVDTCDNHTRKAQDLYNRLSAALDRLHKSIEASQDEIHLTLQGQGEQ